MATKKKRSPVLWAGLLLILGLLYALFVRVTGWALPCPFHAITGLYCPGCGVTRMCLALLRLDFPAAWRANPALLLCLPVLVLLPLWRRHTGWGKLTKGQNALVWGLVAFMLAFGVLRNLPAFSFLQPA